jgi:hypothetical protein
MMKRNMVFLCLALLLAGCTDTIDTTTREYRNTTNEAIDAMMMITNNTQAKNMKIRIFKPLIDRYAGTDKRVDAVKGNRSKKEFVKEVFESDSLHIYLTELPINRQRFTLELTRLRTLQKKLIEEDKECTDLTELLTIDSYLGPLRKHLQNPKIVEMMQEFPGLMKTEKEYPAMFDQFEKKRKSFALLTADKKPREIKLAD